MNRVTRAALAVVAVAASVLVAIPAADAAPPTAQPSTRWCC
jgi:hypothetical protein